MVTINDEAMITLAHGLLRRTTLLILHFGVVDAEISNNSCDVNKTDVSMGLGGNAASSMSDSAATDIEGVRDNMAAKTEDNVGIKGSTDPCYTIGGGMAALVATVIEDVNSTRYLKLSNGKRRLENFADEGVIRVGNDRIKCSRSC